MKRLAVLTCKTMRGNPVLVPLKNIVEIRPPDEEFPDEWGVWYTGYGEIVQATCASIAAYRALEVIK